MKHFSAMKTIKKKSSQSCVSIVVERKFLHFQIEFSCQTFQCCFLLDAFAFFRVYDFCATITATKGLGSDVDINFLLPFQWLFLRIHKFSFHFLFGAKSFKLKLLKLSKRGKAFKKMQQKVHISVEERKVLSYSC